MVVLADLTNQFQAQQKEIRELKEKMAAKPAEPQPAATVPAQAQTDKLWKTLSTDADSMFSHLEKVMKSMGASAASSNIGEIMNMLAKWRTSNDPAVKQQILAALKPHEPYIEYIQAASSFDLDQSRRLQDIQRQKEAAEQNYKELSRYTLDKAVNICNSFKELENAPAEGGDIASRVMAPQQHAVSMETGAAKRTNDSAMLNDSPLEPTPKMHKPSFDALPPANGPYKGPFWTEFLKQ